MECIRTKSTTQGILPSNWRMKWLSRYFRETSLQHHFAQRDNGSHGYLVFCYENDEGNHTIIRKAAFRDQIINGTSKQDVLAVLSTLEAFITDLQQHLPNIMSLSLLSESTGCYRSSILHVVLPVVAGRCGIKLERFIHTETQNGKSLIDVRFTQSRNHYEMYMETCRNVSTLTEAFEALASHGGTQNEFVQLLGVDGHKFSYLSTNLKPLMSKAKSVLKRYNETVYDFPNNCRYPENVSELFTLETRF